jgi:L-asparaginase II
MADDGRWLTTMADVAATTAASGPGSTRFAAGALAPIAVGAGVTIGSDGRTTSSIGDPELVVYPRSALKPLQAAAMIGLGLELPDDELAIVCASHDGDREHVAAVRRVLARFGLRDGELRNTPSLPLAEAPRERAVRAGTEPSPLLQNCSGKHAGMLATCVVNGWSTARGPEPVAGAMTAHPDLVGGPQRDISIWMRAVPGLVAKEGAAATMAFATADGRAGAFKIADGTDAARRAVLVAALAAAGVDVVGRYAATAAEVAVPVLGHGAPVGVLRPLEWVACSS